MDDEKKRGYSTGKDDDLLDIAEPYTVNEIIGYSDNTIAVRCILNKITGSINLMSFDNGQGMVEKISAFDSFSQIIEGRAEIVINKISHQLETGMCIIIPAHAPNSIKPNGRFKMILTTIKSGYE